MDPDMKRFSLVAMATSGLVTLGLSGNAGAQSPCDVNTVRAPAPRIVVEMSKPQVIINEVDAQPCEKTTKEKCHLFHRGHCERPQRETRAVVGMVMAPVYNAPLAAPPPCGSDGREPRHQALAGIDAAYQMDIQA